MSLLARRGALIVLSSVLTLSAPPALAQQPPSAFADRPAWESAPSLTLADALREAVAQNPSLAAARASVATLEPRVAAERVLMPPRAQAQIWAWPVTTLNPSKVDMYMFMLEQELPGKGKRAARSAVAAREVAVVRADVDMERLKVAGAVRRAYAALALARRDIVSAMEAGRSLEQLVDTARATYATGGGSQAAVVRAMLEVTRVRERIAESEGDARMATATLNGLMNRLADAPIGPLDALDAGGVPDVAAMTARAVERHPEVRAARAALERAESAIALARLERKSDWMVQGGYMLMPGAAGAWTASVGLTWPNAPWSRQRLTAANTEAERRRDAARAQVAAAEARVRVEVQEAAAREQAARARIGVLRDSLVPQTRHLVDATRLAFETGQGSLAEALEARQVLLEAQFDEARALATLQVARADLDAASGDDWLIPFTATTEQ